MPYGILHSPSDESPHRLTADTQKQTGLPFPNEADRETTGSTEGAPVQVAGLSDVEIQATMHKLVTDAIHYVDQELSPQRSLAEEYYFGRPFGNEEEGRSKVVLTVLRDTVLQMMPSLMRIFFGPDRPIEFAPNRADQIEMAKQATTYVWDVVVQTDNDGFLAFYEWFKDALIKRLGIVKFWVDDRARIEEWDAILPELSLYSIAGSGEAEVVSVEPNGIEPGTFKVRLRRTVQDPRLRFQCVPPEEFLFTRGARSLSGESWQPGTALFVGHRTHLTRSQLRELGVSEADIEAYAFLDVSLTHNVEEITRQRIVPPDVHQIGPEATQRALYIEGYTYLDTTGSGVATLHRVVMLGPTYRVISVEPAKVRPFVVLCPDPTPHNIGNGQGVADWTMDLQQIMSAVMRAILDSLVLTLHPRIIYADGEASLADIQNTELGAPIRATTPDAVRPMEHSFVGQAGLAVLDSLKDILEARTGVTKASAGLDADALQSTTQSAVVAAVTAAQSHIEMIARIFAEMGVKPLFRHLLRLTVENPPVQRLIRLHGGYVAIDPSAWDPELDVRVRVAIGAGVDDQKWAALADTRETMKWILQAFGPDNPIVRPKHLRDLMVAMLKLRGRADAEAFFGDVPLDWAPQPQGDPNAEAAQMLAQAEMHKAETQRIAALAKQEAEAARTEQELLGRIAHLETTLEAERAKQQVERDKAALQAQTQIALEAMRQEFEATRTSVQQELAALKAMLADFVAHRKLDLETTATMAEPNDNGL